MSADAPTVWVVHDMRRSSERLETFMDLLSAALRRFGIEDVASLNVSWPQQVERAWTEPTPEGVVAIGRLSLFMLDGARRFLDAHLDQHPNKRVWVVQWRNDFTLAHVPDLLQDRVQPPLERPALYSWFPDQQELEAFVSSLADDIATTLTGRSDPPPPLTSDELLDLCYGLVVRGQCDAMLLTEFRAETLRNGLRQYGPGTLAEQAHRASRQLGTGLLERADPVWLAWVRHLKMHLVEELGSRLEQHE